MVKVGLIDSCGNTHRDEAAMHAVRSMRFTPYTFGSNPMDVTLVVPIHIPRELGRSR